jgi:Fe-S cluster assembly protein SufD
MIPVTWRDMSTPGALSEGRRSALEAYLAQGLPHSRQEDWHYTALDHLTRLPLHPASETDAPRVLDEAPGDVLIFAGGRLIHAASRLPSSILHALQDQDLEATATLAPATALVALNNALWRGGGYLEVPPGQRLERPVFLRFLNDEAEAMSHPRSRIRLGAGAEAVLVESYAGGTEANYWCNALTEIELAPGARLTHVRLIEEGAGATHTGYTAVQVTQDSRYDLLDLSLSGRICRHELHLHLAGEGAACRLDGVFLADGRRHSDHHLRVKHTVPRTMSRTRYRGIASGRGRGIFDARALIRPGADGAEARQDSRNLLLSPHAEIDAKPQLEIYADQIQASHGATVGRLSDETLFYLRARGIADKDARRLLLTAFVGEALGLIQEAGLGDWLSPRIEARLDAIGETMK